MLDRKPDWSWRESIETDVVRWWETMAMQAAYEAAPINPMRLFAELSPRLPDDAIVTADFGSAANWYARQLRFRGSKTKLPEFLPHREGAAGPGSHHREQSVTTAPAARHSSQKGGVTDDQ